MEKLKNKETCLKICFVLIMFLLAFIWSCNQPYASAPDEGMKMDICRYVVEHASLPHGGDESIRDSNWGISYGFTPILSYIVSAIFMRITMLFTTNDFALVVAARFVSVLCYTGTVIMVMKISQKLFTGIYQWIFMILIACLPQFVFLGTYINNDSLALFSISIMIYSWILGLESKWNWKSCICLAIGAGICALSYYNAYSFILGSGILYLVSYWHFHKTKFNWKDFIKKSFLMIAIVLLIAGWWFIRSAILYNGDFLGLKTTDEYGEKYALEEYKPSQRQTPQKIHASLPYMFIKMHWLDMTYKSFVGLFGNMVIELPISYYCFTLGVFAFATIGFILNRIAKRKEEKDVNRMMLEITMMGCMIITVALGIYYSYASDFQAQGRYVMPILIPLMYFFTVGIKEIIKRFTKDTTRKKEIIAKTGLIGLSIVWTIIPWLCLFFAVIPFYSK